MRLSRCSRSARLRAHGLLRDRSFRTGTRRGGTRPTTISAANDGSRGSRSAGRMEVKLRWRSASTASRISFPVRQPRRAGNSRTDSLASSSPTSAPPSPPARRRTAGSPAGRASACPAATTGGRSRPPVDSAPTAGTGRCHRRKHAHRGQTRGCAETERTGRSEHTCRGSGPSWSLRRRWSSRGTSGTTHLTRGGWLG